MQKMTEKESQSNTQKGGIPSFSPQPTGNDVNAGSGRDTSSTGMHMLNATNNAYKQWPRWRRILG